MARKVILDVDPGIDDALAVIMALFDPRLEVVALTATAGNVGSEQATRNVHTLIEQLDPPRWPRIGASTEEIDLPATSYQLYGEDGLGNANFPVAELHQRHAAEKVMVEEVKLAPEAVTVLALAPLTNLALAMRRDGDWANQVGQIVIMGGTVTAPGNITAAAEFNIFCNPMAARAVFASPTTKSLVPLDVAEQVVMTFDLLDQLPDESSRAGALLRKMLPFAFRAHRQHLGLEGIYLHDAVALVAMLHPELFTWTDLPGDVEISGELTTGATVFDRRRTARARRSLAVATDVDAAAVLDVVLRSLHTAAQATRE